MGYPRAPGTAELRYTCKLRSRTPRQIARCKSLLKVLYRHATVDAVISQACERLERALIDECKRKGKTLPESARLAPDQLKAATESKRPMISE